MVASRNRNADSHAQRALGASRAFTVQGTTCKAATIGIWATLGDIGQIRVIVGLEVILVARLITVLGDVRAAIGTAPMRALKALATPLDVTNTSASIASAFMADTNRWARASFSGTSEDNLKPRRPSVTLRIGRSNELVAAWSESSGEDVGAKTARRRGIITLILISRGKAGISRGKNAAIILHDREVHVPRIGASVTVAVKEVRLKGLVASGVGNGESESYVRSTHGIIDTCDRIRVVDGIVLDSHSNTVDWDSETISRITIGEAIIGGSTRYKYHRISVIG